MSGPNFDSFVEGASPEERERLRAVHDLLVAAGPPPELPPALAEPPAERVRRPPPLTTLPRRRLGAALTLAAATAVAAFGIGYLVGAGNDSGPGDFISGVDLRMTPTPAAPGAAAVLRIGTKEAGGNIPLAVTTTGLAKLPRGGYYELWLTKKTGSMERRILSCGTFLAPDAGQTVRLNAPYTVERSKRWGWVVTRHLRGSKTDPVLLTT